MSPPGTSSRPATPVAALGVVVPARDEERRISRCLGALTAAASSLRTAEGAATAVPIGPAGAPAVTPSPTEPPAVRIVVVADDCTDGTADIAGCWPDVEVLTTRYGMAGAARAAGAARLIDRWRRAGVPLAAAWIANTDADSVVPAGWLVAHLAAARSGVDLRLGTVRPDLDDPDPLVVAAWHRRHALTEGHPHVHGANLGVRADMYCRVGGFVPAPDHEDAALAAAVTAAGGIVDRTAAGPVRTSARLTGRTPGGLAGYLRDLRRSVRPLAASVEGDPAERPA